SPDRKRLLGKANAVRQLGSARTLQSQEYASRFKDRSLPLRIVPMKQRDAGRHRKLHRFETAKVIQSQ
ncbi:MAG: hypothetical protein AAGF67_17890, partial [Verrucomicrobiota bacterium]